MHRVTVETCTAPGQGRVFPFRLLRFPLAVRSTPPPPPRTSDQTRSDDRERDAGNLVDQGSP
jgi:hypothetical protein